MDPKLERILKAHPIDDLQVANEKFNELASRPTDEQADFFAERYATELKEEGIREIYKLRDNFKQACEVYWSGASANSSNDLPVVPVGDGEPVDDEEFVKRISKNNSRNNLRAGSFQEMMFRKTIAHATSKDHLPIKSTGFSSFLEKCKKPMSQLKRKEFLDGVLSGDDSISLIGYLLYHHRRKIALGYFRRRRVEPPREVFILQCGYECGNKSFGYEHRLDGERKLVAEMLKEEVFTGHYWGVNNILDEGMIELNLLLMPLKQAIFDLENALSHHDLSIVKKNQIKSELHEAQKDYAEPFDVSYYPKFVPELKKVNKINKQTYLEIKEKLVNQANPRLSRNSAVPKRG